MVEKAVIYDTDNGRIVRVLTGDVKLERENIGDDESAITGEEVDIPEDNIQRKKVDTSGEAPSIVDDPDYEPPTTTEDIKREIQEELESGEISTEEALTRLLEL